MTLTDTVATATNTLRAAATAADQELTDARTQLAAALAGQRTDAAKITDLQAQVTELTRNAVQARRPRTGPRGALTKIPGDLILTDANPNALGYDVGGRIIARTAYPSARHCIVRGGPAATGETALIDSTSSAVKSFTIEDVTIEPAFPTLWTSGIKGHHWHGARILFRRLCDGFQAFNTTAKGSDLQISLEQFVMEAFYRTGSDPRQKDGTHNDGGQWQGGYGLDIHDGLIDLSSPDGFTGGSFSALMVNTNPGVGPVGPSKIRDLDILGGTTPINAGGVSGVDLGSMKRLTLDGKHTGTHAMVMTSTTKLDIGKGTGDANRFANGTEMVPKVYPA